MCILTRRPTELLEPGPYVGELKAQSSSIQLAAAPRNSMSSSADAASDVASEAPTQVADAKKKKSKKKTTIGVTSAALVDAERRVPERGVVEAKGG